jgi:flagellar basal-body rod modification protein FlgD
MDTTIQAATNIPTTSTALQSTNKAEQQKSQFLQLLVAQLKGQNPLDPKDGTEFVSQLAQFSSLEELINIRTSLESIQQASTTTSGNQANPFQLTKE